jgi:acetyl esterase/lipase/lysophospholipase L1-like esterase
VSKFFFTISFFVCANVFAQQYSNSWKDIDYAGDRRTYHMLDIYLPADIKEKYPVVIAIYGSAWFGNNLKESAFQTFGDALLNAGFAVVTPNHRSSHDSIFPAQIHDIKAAIRFIRANAGKYQLDTSFIGITGFSSGGHLAALAGTSGYVKKFTSGNVTLDIEGNVGNYLMYNNNVDAVVDWFGPTDILNMDSCETTSAIDHSSPSAPEAVLIGGPVKENMEKATLANPITYVDRNDPPFLIFHGDADPLVSYCQSVILYEALQEAGVESQLILVKNAQHGAGLFEEKYFKMMTDFFLRHMKRGTIASQTENQKWVGTWTTSPQLVEPQNNPPDPPGLTNNTIRQIVRVSLGGDVLRVRFSNEFSGSPVTINSAHVAVSKGNGVIDKSTDKALSFNGKPDVTMAAGSAVISDPLEFDLTPLTDIAITIYFGNTSRDVTGHPGSRTTSYILAGNNVDKEDFASAVTTDHWYVINTIDVLAPDSAFAVVTLGNSITDGRGSGTNKQNRWPDELAKRLQANPGTKQVAVLNAGIGGNCVLKQCLGPSALSRFERDVLNQNGVRWLIILEGINDIGGSNSIDVADDLIEAYKQMIYHAHSRGIYVYGATLLPMKGSFYFSETREAARQKVNEWIRTGGYFDAVIDLDRALRNPEDTLSLLPEADTGDHLHPNETGHRMIAEAVDLTLFTKTDSLIAEDQSHSIFLESECGAVGSNWQIIEDDNASNGKYVTIRGGLESLNQAPTGDENIITIPFSIDTSGVYYLMARVNCPTYNDDSFWISVDNEDYRMYNGLASNGWEWKLLDSFEFDSGEHIISVSYREDGAGLDKLAVSDLQFLPLGEGEAAINLCDATDIKEQNNYEEKVGFILEQNYPNPFNPTTRISFEISKADKVSLKIYDLLGKEIVTLFEGFKHAGEYSVNFDADKLSSGIYICRLVVGNKIDAKKILLMK